MKKAQRPNRTKRNKPHISPAKAKLLFVLGCAMLCFVLLIGKLFQRSVLESEKWTKKAMAQWQRTVSLQAERGEIMDRNGTTLASSYTTYQVCVNPQNIQQDDQERIATILATYLDLDYDSVYNKITKQRTLSNGTTQLYSQIKVDDQVDREVISQLNSMQLGTGVSYYPDVKRDYPETGLYAQLIGFTNIDGDGQTGVELTYNSYLSGVDGYQKTDTDRDNNPAPGGEEEYVEPIAGADVVLTTDTGLQAILENALQKACIVNNAKTAQGVLLNPNTGEIYAIGTYPTFDSSNPPRSDATTLLQLSRSRIVTDTYEPGSTFKVITLAAALESGAVSTATEFDCSGSLTVGGDKIGCWKDGGHKHQTLSEAVANSCNPAFMSMALKMGVNTFYDYIYAFGFNDSTGSGIMGETSGTVTHKKYVREPDLARIGFGQSISCTGMQLAMAVSACINGGELIKPYVVSEIVDPEGNVLLKNEPTVVRRVISESTSATVRGLLENVVENGSGKNARVYGYSVGGKTGTSQKYDEDGNVSSTALVASFIGFAPVDDPQFLCLIVVDEPQVPQVYGSTVAAPFVQQVLSGALSFMGVQPDKDNESTLVPSLIGLTVREALDVLDRSDLEGIYLEEELDSIVTNQVPVPNTTVVEDTPIILYSNGYAFFHANIPEVEMVEIPDLYGKDRLGALDALNRLGLIMDYDPENCVGTVTYVDYTEGLLVPVGTVVRVEFTYED